MNIYQFIESCFKPRNEVHNYIVKSFLYCTFYNQLFNSNDRDVMRARAVTLKVRLAIYSRLDHAHQACTSQSAKTTQL